jgi:amidase
LKKFLKTEEDRLSVIREFERFLTTWDVLICPVTSSTAFEHLPLKRYVGPQPVYKKKKIDVDGRQIHYGLASVGLTSPFNVTGNPVVVVPIGKAKNGMPFGVQILGKRWQDIKLLSIVGEIENCLNRVGPPPGY